MDRPRRNDFFSKFAIFGAIAAMLPSRGGAQTNGKRFITNDGVQARAYSQAVVTTGGKMVFLAGQTGARDAAGNVLSFEGQVRSVFATLQQTLAQAGGKLSDLVYMTCFITDIQNAHTLTRVRGEILGDHFPASAIINIVALASPETLIEIQCVAVVPT
jgi:2-iminobutanoate/2-iminopropanoate deaminase